MTALRLALLAAPLLAALAAPPATAQPADAHARLREVVDYKSVYGEVRSRKVVAARARVGGTLAELSVTEGDAVTAGQVIGVVADAKLALRIEAASAQIGGLEAELANAQVAYDRAQELFQRKVVAQARLDDAKARLDVARNQLETARAERRVAQENLGEGVVLAPSAGRVLRAPLTTGSVVTPGDSVAEIATEDYVLRLSVPERHAEAVALGRPVLLASRGMGAREAGGAQGKVAQVYPLLENGRVVADAEVPGLGDYFVGERAQAWLEIGRRSALTAPRDHVVTRRGVDFALVAREGLPPLEVVVRLGPPLRDAPDRVEVLSGLRDGDTLLLP